MILIIYLLIIFGPFKKAEGVSFDFENKYDQTNVW